VKYFVHILIMQQSFAISLFWGVLVTGSTASGGIIPSFFCILFVHNFDLCWRDYYRNMNLHGHVGCDAV